MNRQNKGKRTRSVKNQMRGIRRLLKKPDLPEEARMRAQKQLAKLEKKAGELQYQEQSKKHQKRYRKVKFFEKKKINRSLMQCRKALKKEGLSDKKRSAIRERIRQCHLDLQYIEYFPKDRKYVSLFMNDGEDKETFEATRQELRKLAAKNADCEKDAIEDEEGFVEKKDWVPREQSKECEETGRQRDDEDDFFQCSTGVENDKTAGEDEEMDDFFTTGDSAVKNEQRGRVKQDAIKSSDGRLDGVKDASVNDKDEDEVSSEIDRSKIKKKAKKKKKKKRPSDETNFTDSYSNSSEIIFSASKKKKLKRQRQKLRSKEE